MKFDPRRVYTVNFRKQYGNKKCTKMNCKLIDVYSFSSVIISNYYVLVLDNIQPDVCSLSRSTSLSYNYTIFIF